MRIRRSVVPLVWSMLAIGAASLAPPLRAQFVYVGNNGSDNISAYSIGATGALTPTGAPVASRGPTSVAIHPTGKFAYVADQEDDTVSAYSIGATGVLTPIGATASTGSFPKSVAVDPTGRFVYVANLASNTVSAYSIGSTGMLTPIGDPVAAGSGPWSVAVDPMGNFVYVANSGSNDVSAYSIGATGVLTPIGATVAAGSGPQSVAVDPTGNFVYVANFGSLGISNGTISAYSIGATGELTPIGAVPAAAFAASVAVDPTGKFAYAASQNSFAQPGVGFVSAYRIGATGMLTPIGDPVSVPVNFLPDSVAVDPTGRFVYVANFTFGFVTGVSAYSIGATGGLTPIQDMTVLSTRGPVSIAVSPIPPPSCQISQIVAGPPKQLIVAIEDTVSGLASINLLSSVNAFVSLPAFSRGTTSQLLVTATKIDQTQSSDVGFLVTNMAGLTTSCDPVDFTVTLDRLTERHVFRSVNPSERYIRITNGTPGVRRMTFSVNGHAFQVPALQDGETFSLDIGSALLATTPDAMARDEISGRWVRRRNPGQALNSVLMYASGQRGASAYILIGDSSVQ